MAAAQGKKAAVNVTVAGETYLAGDEIPADVVSQIDNPKVWGNEPRADDKAPARKAASSKTEQ